MFFLLSKSLVLILSWRSQKIKLVFHLTFRFPMPSINKMSDSLAS